MAENFRRRFSFRHLSFRKAKKQPLPPKSSADVTRSQSFVSSQSGAHPKSATRSQSVVCSQSVTPPKSATRSQSVVCSQSVTRPKSATRSQSVVCSQSVTRPKSTTRSQSVVRSQAVVHTQSVKRPAPSVPHLQTELKRSASVRPRSCVSRERSSNLRRDATKRASVQAWNDVWNKPVIGRAIQPFTAILCCDLTFEAGDQILILTQTSKQFDWWEGSVRGHTGIFPANYIQVLD